MPQNRTVGSLVQAYKHALAPIIGKAETRAVIRAAFETGIGDAFPELIPDRTLSHREYAVLQGWLKRLVQGEPLQYVLGMVMFMGLHLAVDPRVLIPRPETEELVHRIVSAHTVPPHKVIDVGTGSGCIALALKKAWPQARVLGLDVSDDALAVARGNAARNALQVEWRSVDALGDGLRPVVLPDAADQRVLVVSNPPYVPRSDRAAMQPQVIDHEPHLALFVEDDDPQRFYRAIAQAADHSLRAGDEIWFEVHQTHAVDTAALMRGHRFVVDLLRDLSGNYRFVRAHR